MGKWIIYTGLLLVVIGVIVQYAPWAVGWFGRLPGDIRIEGSKGRILIPITSMIVVSLVLTILVNVLKR